MERNYGMLLGCFSFTLPQFGLHSHRSVGQQRQNDNGDRRLDFWILRQEFSHERNLCQEADTGCDQRGELALPLDQEFGDHVGPVHGSSPFIASSTISRPAR